MAITAIISFLKAHWQALVLVVLVGVGYGWFKHLQASSTATINALNAANAAEVAQMNADRAAADAAHAVELKQLNDNLATIQTNYAQAQAQLAVTQTQETQAIVQKYGTDADGLADLAAQKLGLTVVK